MKLRYIWLLGLSLLGAGSTTTTVAAADSTTLFTDALNLANTGLGNLAYTQIFKQPSILNPFFAEYSPDKNGFFKSASANLLGPGYESDRVLAKEELPAINSWLQTTPTQSWTQPFTENGQTFQGHATFIPAAQPSKLTVIVGQGYRTGWKIQTGFAKTFYDMGYNILAIDAHAQNQAGGTTISFGYKDKFDWPGWINKINAYTGPGSKQVLWGQSLGAATINQVEGLPNLPTSVKAAISDATIGNLEALFNHLAQNIPFIDRVTALAAINHQLVMDQGFSLSDVSPQDSVKTSTMPELVITTQDDDFIPAAQSRAVFDNIPVTTKKQLWILPGTVGGHTMAPLANLQYTTHIQNFLRQVDPSLVPTTDNQLIETLKTQLQVDNERVARGNITPAAQEKVAAATKAANILLTQSQPANESLRLVIRALQQAIN
ncbi:hypothetical protein GPK34_09810 [Secundilactobacillus kimchicus]|uniref:alpha/beta hydrolase n=1 Tax=Secundilactobacillus kimchicus TaxID=528209 RepID=UPI001C035CFE|nr:alpha/beta hydrolase [Secundilactobacillus kimchicus]MBT9672328.1 hypothetical protein [Secundilactobacillus kimchicus]